MSKRMASGKFKGKLLKSDLKPRFLVQVSSVGKRCYEFWGIPTQPGVKEATAAGTLPLRLCVFQHSDLECGQPDL